MISRLALTLAVAAPWSSTAFAQVDPMNMMREAAANQVGVMEYCTKQGYTDVAAVTAQRAALGQLPAGTADTSKAEELGRGGIHLHERHVDEPRRLRHANPHHRP